VSRDVTQQMYELYNGGDTTVKYSIDTEPLDQLQQVSDIASGVLVIVS